jgi:hypothetical protein
MLISGKLAYSPPFLFLLGKVQRKELASRTAACSCRQCVVDPDQSDPELLDSVVDPDQSDLELLGSVVDPDPSDPELLGRVVDP